MELGGEEEGEGREERCDVRLDEGLRGARDAEAALESQAADVTVRLTEERRLTLTARPGLSSASAKWLLGTGVQLPATVSADRIRKKKISTGLLIRRC